MDQTDVVLGEARLRKENIFRKELRAARARVAALIRADKFYDKCERALEEHRMSGDPATEAWALAQLELHRTFDLAKARRADALARMGASA